MYTKAMKRDVLLSVHLVLVGLLLTGCVQTSQAGEPATMTPRPTQALSGSVQAGPLEELVQVNEQLLDIPVSEFQVNGDMALAIAEEDGHTKLIAINLRSGEIAGLDKPLTASRQWFTTERYFAYTRRHPSGNRTVAKVHVYDVQSGREFTLEGDGGSQCCPYVAGDMVVWSEIHGDQGWDVYAYNMASGQMVAAVARSGGQIIPKIENEWLVYIQRRSSDIRDEMRDLYLHNLVTGEDMLIGLSPYASKLEGDTYGIDNGRVVWKGWAIGEKPTLDGPLPTLHVCDLETRTESILDLSSVCTNIPVSFKMAGDLILFSCEGFYGCYDLAQGSFFSVPHPEHWSGYTYLSETYVVFRVAEEDESFWDYMTPGASPMPPEEHWLTPQPARFRLFVVPITR